jgi:hypothetical protein
MNSTGAVRRAWTIGIQTHRQRCFGKGEIPLPTASFHTYADRLLLPDRRNREHDERLRVTTTLPKLSALSVARFHSSVPTERVVAIMLGLGALSAGSYAGVTAIRAYKEWQATPPKEMPPVEEMKEDSSEKTGTGSSEPINEKKQQGKPPEERGENIFTRWFGVDVGSNYYEGGFEESMTRREAALILGVRETSSPSRIKEAHRNLLILNHPDAGGSTFMAGKINEAKELLLKGRRGEK